MPPAGSILVVDDEPAIREAVVELLASEGYRAHGLGGGQEALEWVRRERPALVLVDLVMPVMNGAELLGRLRADPALKGVPVVLMTAATPARGEPATGADAVLRKPFELDELLDAVARHCPPAGR
jgi:CheY-like chemotaxis protein